MNYSIIKTIKKIYCKKDEVTEGCTIKGCDFSETVETSENLSDILLCLKLYKSELCYFGTDCLTLAEYSVYEGDNLITTSPLDISLYIGLTKVNEYETLSQAYAEQSRIRALNLSDKKNVCVYLCGIMLDRRYSNGYKGTKIKKRNHASRIFRAD